MASPGSLPSFRTAPERSSRSTERARLPIPFVPWLSSSRAAGRSGPPTSRAMGRILWRRAFAQRGRPWPQAWGPPFPPSLSPGPWPLAIPPAQLFFFSIASKPRRGPGRPCPWGSWPRLFCPWPACSAGFFPRRRQCSRATPLGFHASWPGPLQSAWRDASLLIPDRPFRERSFRVTQTFSPSGPMGKGLWP